MAQSHTGRTGRTQTGGRYTLARKKRLFELGREPANTTIGQTATRFIKCKGGNEQKIKLLKTTTANVYDPKNKTYAKATIKTVKDNPANRNYTRRNIITKGAIIETDKGQAKITNRPGQEGSINATLIVK